MYSFMKRFCFFIISIYNYSISAQTAQIPLDQGRYTGITSLIEMDKDVYMYSSSIIPPNFFGGGKANNLTQLNINKGIIWSNDYSYSKTTISNTLTNYKGGFLWSGFVYDANRNKLLTRMGGKGNILWSKSYGSPNDVDTINGGKTKAIVLSDNQIVFGGGAGSFTSTTKQNDLFLAKIDSNGNQIWAKNYAFASAQNNYSNFSDLINTPDGGYLICGTLYQLFDKSVLLIKTDATGNLQWVKTYAVKSAGPINDNFGVQVLLGNNNRYILVANQKDIQSNNGQFVAEINADGTVFNSFLIRINPILEYTLQANKAVYDATKNVLTIAAGVTQDSIPTLSIEQNLLYTISLDGKFKWKYNYYDEISIGFLTPNSDLVKTQNGGFAHLTSFSKGTDNLYPILIISDAEGVTTCQKPIDLVVNKNFPLVIENKIVQEKNAQSPIDYNFTQKPFDFKITWPEIDLGPGISTCREDSTITLDPKSTAFDSYKWNNNDTTPILSVNKFGQYYVTAKSSKFCFTISDTIIYSKSINCEIDSTSFDIPTAFTPNNDGVNETFGPIGKGFTVSTFQIYDRFGNLVFTGNNGNIAWNGKINNNQEANSDIYFYFLKYNTQRKEEIIRSGNVTLLR